MSTLFADFEKHYPSGARIGATFEQPADEFSVTILFGASGSGKTTILRCLAGLEKPEHGRICYGSETWINASTNAFVPPQRRGIGFLSQDYSLFPHMTVSANIAYGLTKESRTQRRRIIGDMLEALRLSGLGRRYPNQLSGGEQQRVALARAVVRKPRLLLLDEPLSALDAPTREQVRRELRRMLSTFSIPCFIVTHDRLEAIALGDHMMVMDRGTVLQSGPLDQVFSRPANALVAQMVGVETVVLGRIVQIESGLATIAVGGTRIVAVGTGDLNSEVYVCIRGEDVTLLSGEGEVSSPRNRLPARVVSMTSEGATMRVELDCGFPLTAVVTRPAVEQLNLHVGQSLVALIKAPAVQILPYR